MGKAFSDVVTMELATCTYKQQHKAQTVYTVHVLESPMVHVPL